jgi:hypothetical protein
MTASKFLFVDIRDSDEVYSKRLDHSESYSVYHIPMNMIRFNRQEIIKHLEYLDEIYIVCNSASRSKFIKDKYFSTEPRIKINPNLQHKNLNYGDNDVVFEDGRTLNVKVVGSNSFNLYSIMRITQVILGLLIITLGGYTYKSILSMKTNKIDKIPLIILLLFGLMALTNGITSTCSVSLLLRDYLN